MSQHKATRRQSLRSALCHKKLADEILDSINRTQVAFNVTMDKLGADSAGALDTDYEATLAIDPVFEADVASTDAPHKATLRASLRSALSHRRLADEIADAIEEFQTAHTAMLVKLDAEGGTLASTDFEATLAVETIDADGEGSDAQHKVSLRKSLRSALAHRRMADEIMDSLAALQDGMRSSLAELDTGSTDNHTDYKVTELDPDA